MTRIFFSPENLSFYPEDLKQRYEAGSGWPDDATEISNEDWEVFTGTPPSGKRLGSGADGMPAWVDLPEPTQQETEARAASHKAGLITAANDFINENMWPSKLMLGRLAENEKKLFNLWLDYIDAVQAVDISSSEKTEWPPAP